MYLAPIIWPIARDLQLFEKKLVYYVMFIYLYILTACLWRRTISNYFLTENEGTGTNELYETTLFILNKDDLFEECLVSDPIDSWSLELGIFRRRVRIDHNDSTQIEH